MKKRRAVVGDYCVACGTCLKECPKSAIAIPKGIKAIVDYNKCIGCGKCSRVCPASTIEMVLMEVTT